MKKALILHGTDGNSQENWFPWLAGKLTAEGWQVWVPDLPGATRPNGGVYTTYLLEEAERGNFVFDEETVLIGHSSGAVEVLHLLNNLPTSELVGATDEEKVTDKLPVAAAYLVGVFADDLGWTALSDLFATAPIWDFEKIRRNCLDFKVIHSDNDPHVPLVQAKNVARELGVGMTLISGQGHFSVSGDPKFKEFPALLEMIIKDQV